MQRVFSVRHVVGRSPQAAKPLNIIRHASRQQQPVLRTRDAKSGHVQTPKKEPPKQAESVPWTTEEKKQPLNFKNLPPGTVGAALLLGGIAYYSGELFVAANKTCANPHIADVSTQKDVAARYDETADNFDSEVGMSEWLMGVNKIRGQLAARCSGHVLEVSCGTGRNLGYYDVLDGGKVDSLTFVDLSAPMIDVCKQKWEALYSSYKKPGWFGGGSKVVKKDLVLRFAAISALGEMPLAPTDPPKKYDTIIQTMGLCSTDKPKELLENMVRHLDTSNPDARILLLEHGRSYRQWLNKVLDNSAERHAEVHGCWYNRDIGAIVQEVADQHGLEISRQRRKHIGTTWLFELKPKVVASSQQVASTVSKQEAVTAPTQSEAQPSGGGWRSWIGLK
ncbi:Putative methyltransferase OMS1, S-adenosyl-L-methionine-dependent methyltransferase [Septoria linicola]|uniref:Methyltransferase OMS1, S-adenosyl-L-methionine-dependent methyltransferase n=1 Tax=Septoria linicola TaxID=215465 RepID=A0A9Q9B2H4_9PEZI|nr:putative methyltransferase OMS1, S-adenosyl-L-methionine-dependent methyltransferase [Septoria linicola]USW55151.1 Putative methyltransferase OMS1, S-adenosyl-L-methionine-dependent methyltransferase [Septoria linicola]